MTQEMKTMTFEELEAEVLKLPVENRTQLAKTLVLSLESEEEPDPEHERLWMEEIERRCREIDEGRAVLIPGEEVLRRLRAVLR
jgi:putative addiction module component (TIGR02574 family)